MKIKEILIICIIIICCIFSLQAVSAADAGTSDDTVLSSTDVSVYTLPNLDNQLQSGSVNAGTFSDLQNDTKNGGSITLNKNYTYNSSSDSGLAGGIVISKDTTIDGNGNVIIDANNLARVFTIAKGTTVTLKGITFINANPTTGHGGSILAQGVVHIDNCNFINNTANYANGGAVCLVGSGSTITNSYFEGNKATNNGKDSNGAAGAVFINANNTEIKNSIFIKNIAGLNGGAIGSSPNHIENCTIINCNITNNTANGSAGGVGMQSKNFHIYNSTFKYNEAKGLFNDTTTGPYYPGNGGGLVMRGWDSYAYNCTFIGNIANQHGGGVYSTNTSYNPLNNNTGFELCIFINNTAGSNGGAVDWAAGATYGYIKDSTFTNNTAKRSGGAIHWSGHYGTISNSTFTTNNATGEVISVIGGILGGGDGGAVVWVGSHGMINDSCIFTGNEAKYRGGAIFLHGNATENCTNITVDSSIFKENIAGTNGGAVDWHEGSHDGEILNSIFENNIAKANGGAVYWRGHDGEIINSNFTNNTAKGLLNGPYGNTGDGGAIFWAGVNGSVSNARFTGNRAIKNTNSDTSGRGGAMYIGSCDHGNKNITIKNSLFEDNNAGTNGGAIDWYAGAHDGLVENVTFNNNIANRSGGAIFWNGHNGTIKDSNFTYNQALGITAAKSVLGPVTYGGDGGAVMWSGALGTVDNVRFIGNKAHKNANEDFGGRGGAVFLQAAANETSEDTKFTNVYFEDNVAGTNGGAIDWNKGARDGIVENATFVNNIANRSGGAIFWNGHNGTIKNANFTNNSALGITAATSVLGPVTYGGDGGAVMWSGALGTVENSNFINNTAAQRGGAVFLQSAANETCDNTTFKDSHFENNTAGTNGGAIDWNAGAHNGVVSNVTFVNNVANRSGGAIFWHGYNGTIRDSNFTNNSALGTPIYANYATITDLSQVHEVTRLPQESDLTLNRLYVRVTYADEGQTVKSKYELYVTDPNTYEWVKLSETSETAPSAINWAIDAFFGGDGGSVIWEGDYGLVDNCIFIDSDSARRGGGIYMIGSDYVTISNSYFENTTAGTNGGGLNWLSGANYGKVINCTFNNTKAARSAGAIDYDGDYGEMTNITIINATAFGGFISKSENNKVNYAIWDISHWDTNTTGGDAGAIMFTGNHAYVYNVTFNNCTAAGRGGAVFLQDNNNVTFENCIFEENSALGTANNTWKDYTKERNDANADTKVDPTLTGHGGAIAFDVDASDGIIINSTFNSNHAARDGGAAYYATGAARSKVINSTFTNHKIDYDGGAIYLDGIDCELYNSTFINNSAGDDGGAIHWQGDNGIIYNITCDHNNATSLGTTSSPSKGGAVIITGSNITLSKSTFSNSYSGVVGGTIFITGNNVNITDSVFKNSTIELEDGGALYILGNNTLIANCTFDNSTSPRDGGTIYVLGDVVILRNLTITNSSAITGGAIYIFGEEANIDASQISYTTAENGGGIYISGNNATINNISFSKLNSTEDGAAVYVAGDYGRLFNSKFTNNTAGDDGGAIYWEGDYGIINNVDCNYNKGTSLGTTSSPSKGGSVIITGSHNVLSNSTFANSYAGVVGGTIFVTGNDVNITDSTFKKSRVGLEDGGTLYMLGNNTNILNCTIDDSSARNGGAIFIEGDNATVSAKFTNTNATFSGGSIYVEGENATIVNSSFDNTRAFGSRGDGGGAIFIKGNYSSVESSNFTYNYANNNHEARGGAIYITGLNTTISDSKFDNSKSNMYGGSIYIDGTNTTISKSNFTDCTLNSDGSQGGAIYVKGNNTYIEESTFKLNTAKLSGGAIYIEGTDANVIGSDFIKCSVATSNGQGGSIFIHGSNSNIINSTINESTSKEGGAIYIDGSYAMIDGSSFYKNIARGGGGAIFSKGMGSKVYNSNFTSNEGALGENEPGGGAICWYGGAPDDTIENCTFIKNKAGFGGAIRFNEYAKDASGLVKNCTFIENWGSKGGTISWATSKSGIIDSCKFINNTAEKIGAAIYAGTKGSGTKSEGFNISNCVFTGNKAIKYGGADILSSMANQIIINCNFSNSRATYGGAIALRENDPRNTQIINCNFYNVTATGGRDDSNNAYGGGAIYVSGYSTYGNNISIVNVTIEKASSPIDGGAIRWVGPNGKLINVTIIDSQTTGNFKDQISGNGGAIYWQGNDALLYNVTIINSTASSTNEDAENGGGIYIIGNNVNMDVIKVINSTAKLGGGIYVEGNNAQLNNILVANSSAENGGGIYWNNTGGSINNVTFINNTANKGGGFYTEQFTGTIENSNFTLNKADNGSAIYTTQNLNLNNASLLKNRANNATFDATIDFNTGDIDLYFRGWDNYLNGIYIDDASKSLSCDNVTYLNESGVVNSGLRTYSTKPAEPTLESGQNFTIIVGDKRTGKQYNVGKDTYITDEGGHIHVDLETLVPTGTDLSTVFADVYLTNEDYYTYVEYYTRVYPTMSVSTENATFHLNGTVNAKFNQGPIGNVSIYIDGQFMGNITLDQYSEGTIEIPTKVHGKYLEVGNYTVVFKYGGDGIHRPLEKTAILNVTKANSNILLNVTPSYDSFTVNVTVVHNETGIVTNPNDVTGNVTINVYDKTVKVELVNGTGVAVITDLPVGPIPVFATYSGDDNYLTSVNSTTAELTNRTRTTVKIQVNAHDIMVNETIIINVTVISDGTPVEGNVTIVLDNREYNVTLNNSKASFNKTGLSAGQKVVVALFAGNETLAPSSARDTFMVHKYNATVIIDTENITYSHDEIINITVPEDAEGVVYVKINGTTFKYKAILEIINGTVSIPISRLGVDVYNVTVTFEDDKYKFTTNSTLFNVSKLTPNIIIDVDNVTYGNDTIIVVTVPGVYGGNVTLKINDTLVVFENETLVNNQATFIVKNLPADNYTIDVSYSGDIYDNPNSTSSNFTVYKCDPLIDVIVEDIFYTEVEHIIIRVNAQGNVTVRVAGNETNITLKEDGTSVVHVHILRAAINNNFVLEKFNGRADEYVHDLAVGNYPVEVIYNGNRNFNSASKTVNFNVKPINVTLSILKEDIYVWDNESISVSILDSESYLMDRATGNVTIYIDGVRYSTKIENGIAKFNITDLTVGHKVIWAFYDGDRNLSGNRSMAEFNVKQRTPVVNVTAINVTTAESGKLTINIPANATGYVIVTGNFSNYQIRVDNFNNGVAEIPLEKLDKGTYGVHIKYYGEANDNYTIAENDCIFKVSPANTMINITVKDITYGEKVNITVNVTDGATGFITVGINETTNVTLPIVNGTVNWIVEGLGVENYTVWANYSGDTRFNINSTNKTFKVKMVNSVLNILTPVSVDAATNATIVVTVNETATGNITITVNGTKYNATINDGVATFVINKLLGGTYDITAEYIGDGNNTAAAAVTAQNALVITKVACYQINVTANDTKVGLNTTIVVKVPVDAEGNVSVYVDGVNVGNATINAGVAEWNVTKAYGNHTVNVTFSDGKYDFRYAIADFWVFKYDSPLEIKVDSILVGDTAYINVTAPSDNVTIKIDGKSYNRVRYADNVSYFNVADLNYGNKTVVAIYGGSDKYVVNSTTKNFTVDKRSTNINITVENITYGDKVNITVNVTDDAKGFITIRINETRNITLPIVDGKVNWIVEGLGVENYTVWATYNGDAKYNVNTTNKAFNVTKALPVLSIDPVVSVDAATNATIIVRINETATGNITVTVNNTKYNATIENGVATFVINKLLADTYDVTAEYIGDNNYTAAVALTVPDALIVTKVTCYQINVTANDTKVGLNTTIVVKVPVDAKGNVSIYVDGQKVANATINAGVAEWNVTKAYGNHTVNVTFSDDKYDFRYAIADFWVFKHDSPLEIKVDSILVGDIAYINVTAPSDNVTIKIDGKSYNRVRYADNVSYFNVADLNYGNKTVVAIYGGSDKYVQNTTTKNFTVNKRASEFNVTVTSPISVGDNTTVSVEVPVDAKGYVVVNVGGNNYTINLTAGQRSVEIAGLKNTTYKVNATYIGDDKYLSSINNTQSIKVNKLPSTINLTVSEDGIIAHGHNVNITVEVPVDATGKVNVTLYDGVDIIKSYIIYVNEGKGLLHLDVPAIGLYRGTGEYLGDDKYLGETNETKFEVYATGGQLTVLSESIYVNQNGTINVTIPGKYDGEMTIIVSNASGEIIHENVTITSGTFSNATMTLPLLDAGTYDVRAIYIEVNGSKTVIHEGYDSFNVEKLPSQIIIENLNATIFVGENETIKLAIDLDSRVNDGNISIFVNGAEYNTTTSELTVEIPCLNADDYEVNVLFHGNDWYLESNATASFKVVKNFSPINIEVTNSSVGGIEQINVTLLRNVSGQVLLDIDGQHYYANVSEGLAQFNITGLEAGGHDFNVTYLGDYKFLSNNTNSTLKVSKIQPAFVVNGTNITVGSEELIKFETSENITDVVKVEINDKNYTAFIIEGKGNLTVYNLPAGDYNVTVYFKENEKYLSASAKNNFTINKTSVGISLSVVNITYLENETVVVYVDAVGKVTLKVDTYENTTELVDGKATFIIKGLNAGNYTVNATFNGNDNLTSVSAEANFTVFKIDPIITLEVQNITYGDVEHIIVHVNAEGNVTIRVNGTEETIVLRTDDSGFIILRASLDDTSSYDGKAHEYIYNLKPGEYPVEVTYNGNRNYNTATTRDVFYVSKANSTIKVDVDDIVAGEVAVINITLPQNATGNVTVTINARNFTVKLVNGTASVKVDNLTAGDKSVFVEYPGDANYTSSYAISNFTVDEAKVVPDLSVVDLGNGTVVVVVGDNASGNVTISVDGKNFTAEVINGTAYVTVGNVTPGVHDVEVIYSGDDTHDSASVNSTVDVPKLDAPISVDVGAVTEGEVAVITVTVPVDAGGNVTVYVDGQVVTAEVIGGVAVVEVGNLTAGDKTVTVEYSGDDNYTSKYAISNFTVDEAKVVPDLSVVDLGNGTVVVVVGDNASGNVTVKVGDKEFNATVVNGTAVVELNNLTPGVHDVEVIYSGDDTHDSISTNSTVEAPKYDSPIEITVGEVTEGESAVITVTVPEGASGNVTVYVDGKEYPAEIVDGIATVKVDNLTAGDKTVTVEYSGDADYTSSYAISNFTVDEAKVVPDLTVVDYGNGTVVVVVGDNATGNVTVKVGDKEFNATVVNGTAVVELNNLTPGVHDVEVIYSGDGNHNSTSVNSTVEAPKYDSPINITVGEVTEGESAVITVTVPEGASGNVTVYVDGKEYPAEIVDGTATVKVDNLTAGDKTVTVEYSGDADYTSSYAISNFTVDKAKSVPDLTVVDYGNGTVVVVVGDNATGNVTVSVDGQNFTAEVINGTATVTVGNLTPGVHDVEVIYSGDDAHDSTSTNSTVDVPKYDAPMDIAVGEVTEGEPVVVTVTVPEGASGNVTVYVDGKEYPAEIVDGTATVKVDNLTAGDKSIFVEYSGDDNYTSSYAISNFTVDKAKSVPDLTVVDYGNGTVVVVVGDNATGNVTVSVDGQNFTAEVINGTATVTVGNLTPGVHDVEVIYSGDDAHDSTSTNSTVDVPKYDAPIDIAVGEVTEGEPVVVTVTVPEGASGNVTVYVDGKEYSAEVVDGIATVKVDNLTAGDKSIFVEYSGDDNYTSSYAISNFTVDKAKSVPDLTVVDLGNGTIVVVAPKDATGNVTVKVGDKEFNAIVENGTAIVQLDGLTPGEHEIEVIYSGDGNYENATANTKVTAPKLSTPINVTVDDIHVGDKAIITVNVPEGASGNVTIEIDGERYTAPIEDGKATFEIPDLIAGTKTIAVDYHGDENYLGNHTTAKITVSKCPSFVEAEITDIGVGDNVTIEVSVPYDATGQVLIDIDGVGYYVNVTNGKGVTQIPRIPSGIYNVNLTYTGDDKYEASSNTSSFNVTKIDSFVIPEAEDIYVGDLERMIFTLPSDATGRLEIIINGEGFEIDLSDYTLAIPVEGGEKYVISISYGFGKLTVADLPKGEYTVSVYYEGDEKYLPCQNTTKFTVSERGIDLDVVDYKNRTVVVSVPEDATGTITIVVENQIYVANITDGKAVFYLENATPGVHDIKVIYSGDDTYGGKTIDSKVEIPKYETPISVSVEDIYVDDNETVTVSLPEDAKGKVTISIDGKEYATDAKDGKAVFDVPGLTAGNKTVTVKYEGDDSYKSNETTADFSVLKRQAPILAISEDIKVGDDETISIFFPKDATGRAILKMGEDEYYADIIDGEAKIRIPNLLSGTYDAEVIYEGDSKYVSNTTATKFTVTKNSEPILAYGGDIEFGDDGTVVVTLPSDATGTVTITVDGKSYTAEVINGKAVFTIPGLDVGVHVVDVYYSGDNKYEANQTTTQIIVEESTTPGHDEDEGIPETPVSMFPAGNPILVLMLMLVAVGSLSLRRFKKE